MGHALVDNLADVRSRVLTGRIAGRPARPVPPHAVFAPAHPLPVRAWARFLPAPGGPACSTLVFARWCTHVRRMQARAAGSSISSVPGDTPGRSRTFRMAYRARATLRDARPARNYARADWRICRRGAPPASRQPGELGLVLRLAARRALVAPQPFACPCRLLSAAACPRARAWVALGHTPLRSRRARGTRTHRLVAWPEALSAPHAADTHHHHPAWSDARGRGAPLIFGRSLCSGAFESGWRSGAGSGHRVHAYDATARLADSRISSHCACGRLRTGCTLGYTSWRPGLGWSDEPARIARGDRPCWRADRLLPAPAVAPAGRTAPLVGPGHVSSPAERRRSAADSRSRLAGLRLRLAHTQASLLEADGARLTRWGCRVQGPASCRGSRRW